MDEPSRSKRRSARGGAIARLALAGYLIAAAMAPVAQAATQTGAAGAGTSAGGPSAAPSALGALLHSWVTALLLGIAGIVGIAHVAKRDIAKAVELGLVVLLVGGFAFAPDTIEGLVKTFWQTVFGA